MSLLDELRNRTARVATPAQTSPLGGANQTQALSDLMAARGGKISAGGSTPRSSNLQEQAAVAQTQAELGRTAADAAQASAAVGAQARAQEVETQQQSAALDEARTARMEQYAQKADQLMQELEFGERELDLQKDAAAAEQLGFLTRLSNEKYVHQLDQAAREQMLDQQIGFESATANAVFGSEMDLLKQKLGHADILNMDENEFRQRVGEFEMDAYLEIAESRNDAANQQAMWTSVGGLASAGVQGYGAYESGAFDSDYQTYRDEGGTKSYGGWKRETSEG